ncbi:MAG: hypothetical protein KC502_21885 [Myxococcales bacterium]|nr:hypothetical protein [Myxococcales bacterium]
MAALAHANWASSVGNIASKADFPVLQDSNAAGVWTKMATPGKEYVWVFDDKGVVVSFFKPWQMSLSNAVHYGDLKKVLIGLAK